MIRQRAQFLGFGVMAGLLVGSAGCRTEADHTHTHLRFEQRQFARIEAQPIDRIALTNSSIAFEVVAKGDRLGYQWLHDGIEIDRATNGTAVTPRLLIEHVAIEDAGYYSCNVTKVTEKSGHRIEEMVPSRDALLVVAAASVTNLAGEPFTLYGRARSSPHSGAGCPGSYLGYVRYLRGYPDCGWSTSSAVALHNAADGTGNGSTAVEYVTCAGDRSGCGRGSVNVPHPTTSMFTIYFPNGPLPTASYPITLRGFNP